MGTADMIGAEMGAVKAAKKIKKSMKGKKK